MKTYKDSAKKKVSAKKQTITKKNQMKILELKKYSSQNRRQMGGLNNSMETEENQRTNWKMQQEKLLKLSNRGKIIKKNKTLNRASGPVESQQGSNVSLEPRSRGGEGMKKRSKNNG